MLQGSNHLKTCLVGPARDFVRDAPAIKVLVFFLVFFLSHLIVVVFLSGPLVECENKEKKVGSELERPFLSSQ